MKFLLPVLFLFGGAIAYAGDLEFPLKAMTEADPNIIGQPQKCGDYLFLFPKIEGREAWMSFQLDDGHYGHVEKDHMRFVPDSKKKHPRISYAQRKNDGSSEILVHIDEKDLAAARQACPYLPE